jgi:uncharacterized protein (DUF2147 family)
MKQIMLLGMACILVICSFAQSTTAKIAGRWKTEDKAVLEVYLTTANNFAIKQISAEKDKDKKDNGKLIGKGITGTGNEYAGIVIDPSNNKEYKAKWTTSEDGKTMYIKVKWGLINFNEKWIKQ